MKTTVEIPDELFREAKATAARNGAKLKDLVADGLRLVLSRTKPAKRRVQFPLISGTGAPRLMAAKVKEVEELQLQEENLRRARPGRR